MPRSPVVAMPRCRGAEPERVTVARFAWEAARDLAALAIFAGVVAVLAWTI